MKQNILAISLGGSRIAPDNVDQNFIRKFKEIIYSHKNYKFVVVTGGGKTARKYMDTLKELSLGEEKQSEAGILITRFHARFLMKIFGKPANEELPYNIKKIKDLLMKNQVVFCGALSQNKQQTTDATCARIASKLNSPFINITNVKGLYTLDPKKYKNAKLIKKISWADFSKVAQKIKFHAGQHFVLDQKASKIIKDEKIKTYITNSLNDIQKIIHNKSIGGTVIYG